MDLKQSVQTKLPYKRNIQYFVIKYLLMAHNLQHIFLSATSLTYKWIYSGIPISRTSKGNENWFEKLGFRNIVGKITVKQIQGKRLLVQVIRVLEKSRV